MSQKSHDHLSIPLCERCHVPGFHQGGGHFKGWTWEERVAWQEEMSELYRPSNFRMAVPGNGWDGHRVIKAFDVLPHITGPNVVMHIVEDAGLLRMSIQAFRMFREFMEEITEVNL